MLFFLTDLLTLGCINAIMVVSLNVQYGFAGILNVSQYMYVAIGAYVAGVTTMGRPTVPGNTWAPGWTLPWYLGLVLAGVVASGLGVVIFLFTVRRLRMDYLAIVTVASAYIIWNLIDTNYGLFNGDTGIFGVPYITGNANLSTEQYSGVVLAVAAVILGLFVWVSRRIFRSPYGRVLRGIREDEVITTAFGRTSWRAQLWVFVIGCFMAGVGGGLLIFYITAWSPAAWLPIESFALFSALVIGGSGNYWGAVFGGFLVLEGILELVRFLPSFGDPAAAGAFRLLLVGVLLIAILRYRPEGVIPERWLRWYGAPARRLWGRLRPGVSE